MATKLRKVLWTNIDIDMAEFEEYWTENGYDEQHPDYTDEDKFVLAKSDNDSVFGDIVFEERHTHTNSILVIATLDLCGILYYGYKNIITNHFSDCFLIFRDYDHSEFSIEKGDLTIRCVIHDVHISGVIRERRENISDDVWNEMLDEIHSGKNDSALIEKCTVSLADKANSVWKNHGFFMAGHRFVYENGNGGFIYSDDHSPITDPEIV